MIDAIAGRLKAARIKANFSSAADAAKRFGWTASTYAGHENGSRGIRRSTIMDYARAFRVPPLWLLTGQEAADSYPITRKVHVLGEAAAGVWKEEEIWDERKFDDVPFLPGRYETLEQAAYLVRGPSVDRRRIFEGDFVIVVNYWDARQELTDGDVVLLVRRNGNLTERTVKILKITDDAVEFHPDSTDPRFQKPIILPKGEEDEVSDISVEVSGLVIGVHRRI